MKLIHTILHTGLLFIVVIVHCQGGVVPPPVIDLPPPPPIPTSIDGLLSTVSHVDDQTDNSRNLTNNIVDTDLTNSVNKTNINETATDPTIANIIETAANINESSVGLQGQSSLNETVRLNDNQTAVFVSTNETFDQPFNDSSAILFLDPPDVMLQDQEVINFSLVDANVSDTANITDTGFNNATLEFVTVSPETGFSNVTVEQTNDTERSVPSNSTQDTFTISSSLTNVNDSNMTTSNISLSDLATDDVKIVPSKELPMNTTPNVFKVENLPPPPPVFGEKPAVVFKDDPGTTSIEITDFVFDLPTKNTTEELTLNWTTPLFSSEANITDNTSDFILADLNYTSTRPVFGDNAVVIPKSDKHSDLETTTVRPIRFEGNASFVGDAAQSQHPPATVEIPKSDSNAPVLPPPIFISGSDSAKPLTDIFPDAFDKGHGKTPPAVTTKMPPPPPIIFQGGSRSHSSWVDPRLIATTTRRPIILPGEPFKTLHSEADPKYMSVSELADFALKQMERKRQNVVPEAKGMGVQVFFNTVLPFKFETTTRKPERVQTPQRDTSVDSRSGKLQPPNVLIYRNDTQFETPLTGFTTQPTTQILISIENQPLGRTFYSSDFLLSQLGVSGQNRTPAPTIPSPSPARNIRMPVVPTRTEINPVQQNLNTKASRNLLFGRPLPSPKTPKQIPASSAVSVDMPDKTHNFFDANYLLTQIGLNQPAKNVVSRQNFIIPQRSDRIPETTIKPFVHNTFQPWQKQPQPKIVGQMQPNENIGMKFQRLGQVHTRPIDLRTNANTQPFIRTNTNSLKPHVSKSRQTDRPHLSRNSKPSQQQSLDVDNPRAHVYGGIQIERNTPFWQQTHSRGNLQLGTRLREKFNKKLEASKNTEIDIYYPSFETPIKQPGLNNLARNSKITANAIGTLNPVLNPMYTLGHSSNNQNQFDRTDHTDNTFQRFGTITDNPKVVAPGPQTRMPRTGSDVRRDFNRHLSPNTQKSFQSPQQPLSHVRRTPSNTETHPRFPLASKLGTEPEVSQSRTSAFITDFFNPSFFKTNIRQLKESNSFIPSFSAASLGQVSTQTHWSAPQSNVGQNVPYMSKQGQRHPILPTTALPYMNRLHTIRPTYAITTTARTTPTATKQTWRRVRHTTTTSTTTTTTTQPTPPPTADPLPPPIFDTKVFKTFMPFPKAEDTTNPTRGRSEGIGWNENKTASNSEPRCIGCVFVNDRCLLPDPFHCNMYIECVRQGRQIRAFNRECALGAFFDRKSFLCVDPKRADCPTDRCRKPNTKWYPIQGHCKHYWSCGIREGGAAFAQSECCPDMGGFKEGVGCVENPNCTESCESVINQNAPTGCNLRKTSSPTVYFDGNAKMERPCAPGTLFNELQCTCVQDVTLERSENKTGGDNCTCTNDTTCACRGPKQATTGETSCSSSMALTFSGSSIVDSSKLKQHVGNEGVSLTKSGEAILTGGSKLVLWRYANLMIPLVFAVRLRFLATSSKPRYQTLLSNCDKNDAIRPTFDLSIDTLYNEVLFNINTYEGPVKKFKIMYEPNTWSSVDLIYDGERIVGSVDGRSRNILSAGGIETRPYPLAIGGCSIKKGFKGLIDDVYIYEECIPDEMYGIFMSVLE